MKKLKYFRRDMTYPEALRVLFSIDGKSKEEVEEIKKEYKEVIPHITNVEFSTHPLRMTSY